MAHPDHPVIDAAVIAGPTASGKTAAALAAAAHMPVEVISVDSALIYRGMDIGTAKPDAAERARVPHHLIDILDPAERYSAAAFVQAAQQLIGEIRARGARPLLVGGTMMYLHALIHGLDAMPQADAALREQLAQRLRTEGLPALHAELARVDPITAARLAPGDSQRILRALEVWQLSGQPLSALQARAAVSGGRAARAGSLWRLAFIALAPLDRAWLHARIAERFDAMLAQGFVDEVLALRARGDLGADLPSMRCVGYRQALELLHVGVDLHSPAGQAALRERGVAATRQLAKRQLTWLRGMAGQGGGLVEVACDQPGATARVVEVLQGLPWSA